MNLWKNLVIVLLGIGIAAQASAKNRVALVIGNGDYAASPLKNPINDATDMAKSLRKLGFDVIEKQNLSRQGMRSAMRAFGKKLGKRDVGLFYYAGHGMQVNGRNYLIPVDADVESEDEVEDEGIDAGAVLRKMKAAGNRLNIVILDACRNNPFARSFRSGTRGLARMDGPVGSLIAYATAPGSVAADGATRNGVYTKHLLAALQIPNLTIEQVFKKVRSAVEAETVGKQIPWETSSLKGEFTFNINITLNSAQNTPGLPSATTPSLIDPTLELTLWNEVKNSHNKTMLEAYLQRFPSGTFSELARIKLKAVPPNAPIGAVVLPQYQAIEVVGTEDDAYDYYDAGKYGDAFPIFLYLVNRGNQHAQHYLAWLYLKGHGTPQNYPAALKWYGKSAQRGNAWAQQQLGHMHQAGYGVAVNYEAAIQWYRKSAAQGDAEGQAALGLMVENGWGVKQDASLAFQWYLKAAEQGERWAQFKVGYTYDAGTQVPKDDVQAAKWYLKSASQGNQDAQNNLGLLYELGHGVQQDEQKAFELYLKSAKQGHAEGQTKVGILYEEGRGVGKNLAMAAHWYLASAIQGHDGGQNRLGALYMEGIGVEQNYATAAKWTLASATQGNAWAQQNLGYLYLKGYGVSQDYAQAKSWFAKAAAQNDADAKSNLGWMSHKGLGMIIDLTEALSWYLKAANQGSAWAEHKAGYFYDQGMGTKQNYEQARYWYLRSAKQGNQYAQFCLGFLYENGRGVNIDLAQAKDWYQQAADLGYDKANHALQRVHDAQQ